MNAAHVHLALNHLPVLGTAFGATLLLIALLRKSGELKKITLAWFVAVAILTIPVYLSGEPSEEIAEGLPGVSHAIVEEHEQAAVFAFTGVVVAGVAALAGLIIFRKGKEVPQRFGVMMLAFAVIAAGLMVRTASLGGEIRHTEIRKAALSTQPVKADHRED